MENNNYILCLWRDAVTDPPIKNRPVPLRTFYGGAEEHWIGIYNGYHFLTPDGLLIHETSGDQWFDITTIPGVAREAVQAAVDRLVESSVPSDCECPTCDAIRAMCRELGIVPSGVKDSLTTQEAPGA